MTIFDTYKKRDYIGQQPFIIPSHSQLNQVIMKTSTNVANIPIWQNLSLENLEGEIWKDIPDYEGKYQVSNMGRVKSLLRIVNKWDGLRTVPERILKQSDFGYGYLFVGLHKNNSKPKPSRIHSLMALSFLGHISNKWMVVDHINNNKYDNRIENLQVISHRENSNKDRDVSKYASKYTGVYWRKNRKRWVAKIYHKRKIRQIGTFNTEYEAHLAYQKELKKIIN